MKRITVAAVCDRRERNDGFSNSFRSGKLRLCPKEIKFVYMKSVSVAM